jgi:hypothetical protein
MVVKRVPASIVRGRGGVVSVTARGLEVIEAMAAEGHDQRTICRAIGTSFVTFKKLRDSTAAVGEALERGHARLADELTHILLGHARRGNVVAAIFLAKARLGWREGDPPPTQPSVVINLPDATTPDQYMRMISARAEVVVDGK